jgi:hypothetical protein
MTDSEPKENRTMTKFSFIATTAATLAATAVGLAGPAAAAPTGGTNAADTISTLRGEGYNVQTNGTASVPLSRCIVTGVHGLPNAADPSAHQGNPTALTTVYVDISCPDDV